MNLLNSNVGTWFKTRNGTNVKLIHVFDRLWYPFMFVEGNDIYCTDFEGKRDIEETESDWDIVEKISYNLVN